MVEVSVEGDVTKVMFPKSRLGLSDLGLKKRFMRSLPRENVAKAAVRHLVPDYSYDDMVYMSLSTATEPTLSYFLEDERMMVVFTYRFCGADGKWLGTATRLGSIKGLDKRLHEIEGVRISARMWPSLGYEEDEHGGRGLGGEWVFGGPTYFGEKDEGFGIITEALLWGISIAEAKLIDLERRVLDYQGCVSRLKLNILNPTRDRVEGIAREYRSFIECIKANRGILLDAFDLISKDDEKYIAEADELLAMVEVPESDLQEYLMSNEPILIYNLIM